MVCACALALCAVVCASAQDNNEKKNSVFFYAGPQLSTATSEGGMSLSASSRILEVYSLNIISQKRGDFMLALNIPLRVPKT